MFGTHIGHTPSNFIEVSTQACEESGALRHTVTAARRNPASYSVYVGHPISGIRVARILEMQEAVRSLFAEMTAGSEQTVHCLFPMRTTHLEADEVGANDYSGSDALFAATRHFTLQNRMDAVMSSDAVLVNFDLADDDGRYRLSKGIPFDYGWASACGKPVVAAVPQGNPNDCAALRRNATVTRDWPSAVSKINALLVHAKRSPRRRILAEVFDFTGAGSALSMISSLAEADAQKHRDGGRAIISVIPEGRDALCWHGQIAEVSDWVVSDAATAETIVRQLAG